MPKNKEDQTGVQVEGNEAVLRLSEGTAEGPSPGRRGGLGGKTKMLPSKASRGTSAGGATPRQVQPPGGKDNVLMKTPEMAFLHEVVCLVVIFSDRITRNI